MNRVNKLIFVLITLLLLSSFSYAFEVGVGDYDVSVGESYDDYGVSYDYNFPSDFDFYDDYSAYDSYDEFGFSYEDYGVSDYFSDFSSDTSFYDDYGVSYDISSVDDFSFNSYSDYGVGYDLSVPSQGFAPLDPYTYGVSYDLESFSPGLSSYQSAYDDFGVSYDISPSLDPGRSFDIGISYDKPTTFDTTLRNPYDVSFSYDLASYTRIESEKYLEGLKTQLGDLQRAGNTGPLARVIEKEINSLEWLDAQFEADLKTLNRDYARAEAELQNYLKTPRDGTTRALAYKGLGDIYSDKAGTLAGSLVDGKVTFLGGATAYFKTTMVNGLEVVKAVSFDGKNYIPLDKLETANKEQFVASGLSAPDVIKLINDLNSGDKSYSSLERLVKTAQGGVIDGGRFHVRHAVQDADSKAKDAYLLGALDAYKAAAVTDKDPSLKLYAGNTLRQLGDIEQSRESYKEVIGNPESSSQLRTVSFVGLASSHLQEGNIKQAYIELDQAVKIDPTSETIKGFQQNLDRFVLNTVFQKLGDEQESLLQQVDGKLGLEGYANDDFWNSIKQGFFNTYRVVEGAIKGGNPEVESAFEGTSFKLGAEQSGLLILLNAIDKGVDVRTLTEGDFATRKEIIAGLHPTFSNDEVEASAYLTYNAQANPDVALALARMDFAKAGNDLRTMGYDPGKVLPLATRDFSFVSGNSYFDVPELRYSWTDTLKGEINAFNAALFAAPFAKVGSVSVFEATSSLGRALGLERDVAIAVDSWAATRLPTLTRIGSFTANEIAIPTAVQMGLGATANAIVPGSGYVVSIASGFLNVGGGITRLAGGTATITKAHIYEHIPIVSPVSGPGLIPKPLTVYEPVYQATVASTLERDSIVRNFGANIKPVEGTGGVYELWTGEKVVFATRADITPPNIPGLKPTGDTLLANDVFEDLSRRSGNEFVTGSRVVDGASPDVQLTVARALAEGPDITNPNLATRQAVAESRIEIPKLKVIINDGRANVKSTESSKLILKNGETEVGTVFVYVDVLENDLRVGSVSFEIHEDYRGVGASKRLFDEINSKRLFKDVDYIESKLMQDNFYSFHSIYNEKISSGLSRTEAAFAAAREYPSGKLWVKYGYTPVHVTENFNIYWAPPGKDPGEVRSLITGCAVDCGLSDETIENTLQYNFYPVRSESDALGIVFDTSRIPNYFHGSKSPSLLGVLNPNSPGLKSYKTLTGEGYSPMSGELHDGIERGAGKFISAVELQSIKSALAYSKGGVGQTLKNKQSSIESLRGLDQAYDHAERQYAQSISLSEYYVREFEREYNSVLSRYNAGERSLKDQVDSLYERYSFSARELEKAKLHRDKVLKPKDLRVEKAKEVVALYDSLPQSLKAIMDEDGEFPVVYGAWYNGELGRIDSDIPGEVGITNTVRPENLVIYVPKDKVNDVRALVDLMGQKVHDVRPIESIEIHALTETQRSILQRATILSSPATYDSTIVNLEQLYTLKVEPTLNLARLTIHGSVEDKLAAIKSLDELINTLNRYMDNSLQSFDLRTFDEYVSEIENLRGSIESDLLQHGALTKEQRAAAYGILRLNEVSLSFTKNDFFEMSSVVDQRNLEETATLILERRGPGHSPPPDDNLYINGIEIIPIDKPGGSYKQFYGPLSYDSDILGQGITISGVKGSVNDAPKIVVNLNLLDKELAPGISKGRILEGVIYHEYAHMLFQSLPDRYREKILNAIHNDPRYNKWVSKIDSSYRISGWLRTSEELAVMAMHDEYFRRVISPYKKTINKVFSYLGFSAAYRPGQFVEIHDLILGIKNSVEAEVQTLRSARDFIDIMQVNNKGIFVTPSGNLPARNELGQTLTIWKDPALGKQLIGYGDEGVDFVRLMQGDKATVAEFKTTFGKDLVDINGKPIRPATGNVISGFVARMTGFVTGITGRAIDENEERDLRGFIATCTEGACATVPTRIFNNGDAYNLGLHKQDNGEFVFGYQTEVRERPEQKTWEELNEEEKREYAKYKRYQYSLGINATPVTPLACVPGQIRICGEDIQNTGTQTCQASAKWGNCSVSRTETAQQIKLSQWILYRSTDREGPYLPIYSSSQEIQEYTDYGLSDTQDYYYRVTQFDSLTGQVVKTSDVKQARPLALASIPNVNRNIDLVVSVIGKGAVNNTKAGLVCKSSNCKLKLNSALAVQALPDKGNYFVGWSGDCSGSDALCLVASDRTNITAVFSNVSFVDKAVRVPFVNGLKSVDGQVLGRSYYNKRDYSDVGNVIGLAAYADFASTSSLSKLCKTFNYSLSTGSYTCGYLPDILQRGWYDEITTNHIYYGTIEPRIDVYILYFLNGKLGDPIIGTDFQGVGFYGPYVFNNNDYRGGQTLKKSETESFKKGIVLPETLAPPFNPRYPESKREICPGAQVLISVDCIITNGSQKGNSASVPQPATPPQPPQQPAAGTKFAVKAQLYSAGGKGNVTSVPAGINCGTTCSATFASGTSVTVKAAANATSQFNGWSGGTCSGTAASCTFILQKNVSVIASFAKKTAPAPSPPKNPPEGGVEN